VFGLGGLGGVAAELLCRAGVGRLVLVDGGTFEPSNLNRQVFCFRSTMEAEKTEVTARFLHDINPQCDIATYAREDEGSIDRMLADASAAVLAVDAARACVIISRAARRLAVPLVESWAIPIQNVRVFTEQTPGLEECYQLVSVGRQVADISATEWQAIDQAMVQGLCGLEGMKRYFTPAAVARIRARANPTFGPFVWQNAVGMVLEVFKILLNMGQIAYAPDMALYDPVFFQQPRYRKEKGVD